MLASRADLEYPTRNGPSVGPKPNDPYGTVSRLFELNSALDALRRGRSRRSRVRFCQVCVRATRTLNAIRVQHPCPSKSERLHPSGNAPTLSPQFSTCK